MCIVMCLIRSANQSQKQHIALHSPLGKGGIDLNALVCVAHGLHERAQLHVAGGAVGVDLVVLRVSSNRLCVVLHRLRELHNTHIKIHSAPSIIVTPSQKANNDERVDVSF